MGVLDFLRRQRFVKTYLLTTIVLLTLTLIVNFFGFVGNSGIKTQAGALNIVGIPLIMGTILLTLSFTNRNIRLGRILIRFSYVTLAVVTLCLSLIGLTSFISSFLAGFGTALAQQMSATAFFSQMTLSVTLATLSYYTLPIESVWVLNPNE